MMFIQDYQPLQDPGKGITLAEPGGYYQCILIRIIYDHSNPAPMPGNEADFCSKG
jgi:hypothetical protein